MVKILTSFPRHPKREQTSEIDTPKRDDEYARLFHMGVPTPRARLASC